MSILAAPWEMVLEVVTTQVPPFFFNRSKVPFTRAMVPKKFRETMSFRLPQAPETPAQQMRPSSPSGWSRCSSSTAF